jgi:uncharacterized protein (TIGR03435 family)
MLCRFRLFFLFAVAAGSLAAQIPEFDAASVKPSAGGGRKSLIASPSRITFSNVTMRDCLMAAYDVKDYQISGPDWMRTERFDIVATIPAAASDGPAPENTMPGSVVLTGTMRLMLQKLLTDRFRMTIHREKRDLPVYAMVVGKNGTKLKETENPGKSSFRMNGGSVAFTSVTVQELIDDMSQMRSAEMDRPVVDNTGLKGRYDFTVALFGTQDEMMAALNKGDFGTSIFTLIQEQLGLKLEPQKLALDMVIVDKADRAPTDN